MQRGLNLEETNKDLEFFGSQTTKCLLKISLFTLVMELITMSQIDVGDDESDMNFTGGVELTV